ncbi:MAG: amino acid ABC transporter permease [Candidatus Accumulibacter sp.]|jgi:polar amino acid transport system permease protein|nr:amino acid ABC transporter permease [Accumulibacter sp.]
MPESWLRAFIAAGRTVGLNYAFLLDARERASWLRGIALTAELSVLTILCSLLVGIALAGLLTSGRPWLARPARAFVELMRNTPTLVQIYCAFFVLNMLLNQLVGGAQNNPLTAYAWAVIVLSTHYGAYHAEALRAGIEAVPRAMRESAISLGFSRRELLAHVELPLAFRFALPSLFNNFVDVVKSTTLASAIAVGEVTYASLMIWVERDNVLEMMILIFLVYGVLTLLVSRLGILLENRLRMPGYGH